VSRQAFSWTHKGNESDESLTTTGESQPNKNGRILGQYGAKRISKRRKEKEEKKGERIKN